MPKMTQSEIVQNLVRERGLVTDKEIRAMGIHPQTLKRLVESGKLERASRGLYRLPDPDYEITEHHGLVLGAAAAPKGVVCLLSALQFHVIGTQLPRQLWMALPRGTWPSTVDYPPMRFVEMSGQVYSAGIEEHMLEGQTVRIYGVAKTVADCFKFRNKIGMDVALEALNESWRERKLDLTRVAEYARMGRVWNVMRPYLEAITS
jgi:predicted transcriptional regulator of viral defense system